VFVNCRLDIDEAAFNRKLFLARRRTEKALKGKDPFFYIPSLSASTIVYKGMVMPQHLTEFYPDLDDQRLATSVAVFHQRFSTNTLPRSGASRIRIGCWRITARSTPSRATATGRSRAARCSARRCCPMCRTSCRSSR
jgi:hypothetical protein